MADADHITRTAKALCVVPGHECQTTSGTHPAHCLTPDGFTVSPDNEPEVSIYITSEAVEKAGVIHHREIMGPAWMSYLGKARRLVAANVAAGIVDLSAVLSVDHPPR